ncbi:nucleoside/nucleotide kinase family protein [Microbacterium sp. SS28]|uniref:nucleoside/nucleotide kinase family protein n=1 Tax=Microbacterium sp. SS28 TaxID=2919948 RepID=UPI001FAA51ED|nr:nucleoside/nucleotide kinase family protein [Microbacterium sp. SS28]
MSGSFEERVTSGQRRAATSIGVDLTPSDAVERIARLAGTGRRVILGLAGPPGAGKSTMAQWLAEQSSVSIRIVPMDGFHLANAELERLGTRSRKGAPETFDAVGYAALLGRIRADDGTVVYAPTFDRSVDEAVAGAIPIGPDDRFVVTEGNYLLHQSEGWRLVRPILDEAWWIDCAGNERRRRLIERHVLFGREPADARRFVGASDEANAALVARDRARADRSIGQLPDLTR